jgi:hypothetical protein
LIQVLPGITKVVIAVLLFAVPTNITSHAIDDTVADFSPQGVANYIPKSSSALAAGLIRQRVPMVKARAERSFMVRGK